MGSIRPSPGFVLCLPSSFVPTLRTRHNHSSRRPALHLPSVVRSVITPASAPSSSPPPTAPPSIYRCPCCKAPLPLVEASADLDASLLSQLPKTCPSCNADFPRRSSYVDLTDRPGRLNASVLDPVRQATFQNPLVAFSYERGWRDNFARAGFPGPDMESALALDFLPKHADILDLSCGSGILTRLLAKGSDKRVVAIDFSHAMLLEASSRASASPDLPVIDFIRADVGNLPFADDAFHAIHAGAAMHCWPRLQDSLQEVRRVLAPQGKFFATTFLKGAYWNQTQPSQLVSRVMDAVNYVIPPHQLFRFFQQDELVYLCRAAGFASVDVQIIGSGCAIVRCVNP